MLDQGYQHKNRKSKHGTEDRRQNDKISDQATLHLMCDD